MLHDSALVSPPPLRAGEPSSQGPFLTVARVRLFGAEVSVCASLDHAEHERRISLGQTAVTDPALLDRLLDLPADTAVHDTAAWAETADQPASVVERADDGVTITRRLRPPLVLLRVTAPARHGQESQAVQAVAALAGFAPRWVVVATRTAPERAVLEAQLCGVGLLDVGGRVLVEAEDPVGATLDGWAWLLQEKTYRRWLSEQSRDRGRASRAPTTG